MIRMQVRRVAMDPKTKSPVVLVEEVSKGKILPIWVGRSEATAILAALDGVHVDRPQTHDLMAALLAQLGVIVQKVEITKFNHGVYYAEITLAHQGRTWVVDARPSDALALALRTESPIYASEKVLNDAGEMGLIDETAATKETAFCMEDVKAFRKFLSDLSPGDLEKYLK